MSEWQRFFTCVLSLSLTLFLSVCHAHINSKLMTKHVHRCLIWSSLHHLWPTFYWSIYFSGNEKNAFFFFLRHSGLVGRHSKKVSSSRTGWASLHVLTMSGSLVAPVSPTQSKDMQVRWIGHKCKCVCLSVSQAM